MSESLEFEDIQGLLVSGYADRPLASYLLLRVVDGPAVRRWLGARLDRLQCSEFRSTGRAAEPGLASLCINAAFTASGLTALGLDREVLQGFSREFVEGMDRPARARLLGDDGDSAPETWDWGQAPDIHGVRSVDMLLALFSADASCGEGARSPEIERFVNEEITAASGLDLVQRLDSWPLGPHGRKEHFGFRDGLSNPRIEGLASGSGSGASEQPLPAARCCWDTKMYMAGLRAGPRCAPRTTPPRSW